MPRRKSIYPVRADVWRVVFCTNCSRDLVYTIELLRSMYRFNYSCLWRLRSVMNWKGNIRKEKTAQVDIVSIQSIKITWKVDRNQLILLNIVDEQFGYVWNSGTWKGLYFFRWWIWITRFEVIRRSALIHIPERTCGLVLLKSGKNTFYNCLLSNILWNKERIRYIDWADTYPLQDFSHCVTMQD